LVIKYFEYKLSMFWGMHLPNLQALLKSFKAIKLTQKYMNKYLLKYCSLCYVNVRLMTRGGRGEPFINNSNIWQNSRLYFISQYYLKKIVINKLWTINI